MIGAVYLDQGLDAASALVHRLFDPLIEESSNLGAGLDWKTSLQELTAAEGLGVPEYVVTEAGPDHEKTFTAAARVGGVEYGTGTGRSKKEAEQQAAEAAWRSIRKTQPPHGLRHRQPRAGRDPATAGGPDRGTARPSRWARATARRAPPGAPGRAQTARATVCGRPTSAERRAVPELPEVEVVRRGLARWAAAAPSRGRPSCIRAPCAATPRAPRTSRDRLRGATLGAARTAGASTCGCRWRRARARWSPTSA